MGIIENWQSYVNMTKAKADSHMRVAQYWDRMTRTLSITLICMSGVTTVATLLPLTPVRDP